MIFSYKNKDEIGKAVLEQHEEELFMFTINCRNIEIISDDAYGHLTKLQEIIF